MKNSQGEIQYNHTAVNIHFSLDLIFMFKITETHKNG